MASIYKKWVIGFLTLVVLASGAIYIMLPGQVKIQVDNTKSTFYVWEGNWVSSGVEYSKLYNGTSLVGTVSTTVNQTINENEVKIIRTKNFKKGKIVDTYTFNGSLNDKKMFPISHEIEIFNSTDFIFQYEVSGLYPNGNPIGDATSPQEFGKDMKIYWQDGYYYAKISNVSGKDKLIVKYRIESNYQKIDVRLFDPPSEERFFDDFESGDLNKWDNVAWTIATDQKIGSYSAKCASLANCDMNLSDPIDTSGSIHINVSFRYRDDDLEVGDVRMYWMDRDGNWDLIADMNAPTEDTWYLMSNYSEDSQYFHSGFDIRFWADPESGENVWIDNVDMWNVQWCYQESANVSTACGGLNTGSYTLSPNTNWDLIDPAFPPNQYYDGNWTTAATTYSGGGAENIFINYTKPMLATNNSKWQGKDYNAIRNLSINPICWNYATSSNVLALRVETKAGESGYVNYSCFNGTGWKSLGGLSGYAYEIYEEAMVWEMINYTLEITDPTTADPESVSAGDKISVLFNFLDVGTNVTTGVTLLNVTVGGLIATILTRTGTLDIQIPSSCADDNTYSSLNTVYSNWTIPGSGDINVTRIYFYQGGTTFAAAENVTVQWYYSNKSKIPNTLNHIHGTAAVGWTYVDMDTSVVMTRGNSYFLGMQLFGNFVIPRDAGSNCANYLPNQGTYYTAAGGALANTVPTTSQSTYHYGIFGVGYKGDVPQFGYVTGLGWQVNVTAPNGLSGLQDLFLNASYNGNNIINHTQVDAISYGVADTCTYTSGDWEVDCSDNCTISANVNLNRNNISIIGTGHFIVDGVRITNYTQKFSSGICEIYRINGGGFGP